MAAKFVALAACLIPVLAWAADSPRWVVFRVSQGLQGRIELQLDRNSIRQEGPYRIFWTRRYLVEAHSEATVKGEGESLVSESQKYAVDCAAGKVSVQFLDTNGKTQRTARTPVAKLSWRALSKTSPVLHAVCGMK